MEESIRYLNLLKSQKKNASINISNVVNLRERKESTKLKHLFVLLSTLHYLEVLKAECEKIMSYLVSQH